MLDQATITENLAAVNERVAAAARQVDRKPEDVTLVAVTKTWPAELVVRAYAAGMRHFGENRAEELAEKRPEVEAVLGRDSGIVWHMIGTLQSRKTDLAATHADVFHALDRLKIARRLARDLGEDARPLPVFVEVNLSGEASKAGYDCANWETDATQRAHLRNELQEIARLPGLELVGLMTMAPWDVPEDVIRDVFRRTRQLREWLHGESPGLIGDYLSMGMTDDFELAIEEGATHIRVGRALFGERSHP